MSRRFHFSTPSPEDTPAYAAAIAALSALNHDGARRALAERLHADSLADWKSQGYKESRSTCYLRLIDRHCPRTPDHNCQLPGFDHTTIWTYAGKPAVLVTQPYDIGLEEMEAFAAFARQHDLALDVYGGRGWHFPGWTLFVSFSRKDRGPGAGLLVPRDSIH